MERCKYCDGLLEASHNGGYCSTCDTVGQNLDQEEVCNQCNLDCSKCPMNE